MEVGNDRGDLGRALAHAEQTVSHILRRRTAEDVVVARQVGNRRVLPAGIDREERNPGGLDGLERGMRGRQRGEQNDDGIDLGRDSVLDLRNQLAWIALGIGQVDLPGLVDAHALHPGLHAVPGALVGLGRHLLADHGHVQRLVGGKSGCGSENEFRELRRGCGQRGCAAKTPAPAQKFSSR